MLQPSREKVTCGYPGCNITCQRRTLKRHYTRRHPNQPVILKNAGFGQSGRWSSWVQSKPGVPGRSVVTASKQPDVGAPSESSSTLVEDTNAQAVDPASSGEDDPAPAGHPTNAASECGGPAAGMASSSASQRQDRDVSGSVLPTTCSADGSSPAQAVPHRDFVRLAGDVAVIKRCTTQLVQLAQPPSAPRAARAAGAEGNGDRGGMPPVPDVVDLLSSARSLHALELITESEIFVQAGVQAVICTTCVPDFDAEVHLQRRVAGVFFYDFSTGTSFPPGERVPAAFSRLKTSVKEHLKGCEHKRRKMARYSAAKEQEMRSSLAATVNVRVARTAYLVLKTSMPRERFEDMVVLQHINGLDMGSSGHSSRLIEKFRAATHEVLMDQLRGHVTAQPCVALMADKVTINHRTVDVTALMSIVPAAPAGQLVQTYVIGAPVVVRHDGKSMAEQWRDTAASVGITSTEQLAAICTDGQYLHNHVPEKFLQLLDSASGRPAVPCLWDGAHLLQLAEKSARSEAASAWVERTIEAITRVTKRFRLGAGLEQLRAEAEERGAKMKCPQLWSDTRFAPHAAVVLEACQTNLALMEAVLQRQIPFCPSKAAADDMAAELRILKATPFRLRLAALLDVYGVLSRLSKQVQDVQKLPWERQGTLGALSDSLREMARGLPKESPPAARKGLQRLDTAGIRRQLQEGTDAEFEELWPNLSKVPVSPVVILQQVGEIGAFCGALADHCRQRDAGADSRGNRHGSDNAKLAACMDDVRLVGDLLQLRSARFVYATVDIAKASERLQRSGLIPASCTMDSVRAVYDELHSNACERYTSQQQLLKHLLLAKSTAMKPYVDLVVRIWLMSPPESVVESMASAVKEVFGMHRNLAHANAAMELAIRWNGPDLCAADQVVDGVVAKMRTSHAPGGRTSGLLTGKVLRRHLGEVCARSRAFFCGVYRRAIRHVPNRM